MKEEYKQIGDWRLEIGDCNPQSPIPNPHLNYNKVYLYN